EIARPRADELGLLRRRRQPDHVTLVFASQVKYQTAPTTADVEESLSRSSTELRCDIVELLLLRARKVVGLAQVNARAILERGIEEERKHARVLVIVTVRGLALPLHEAKRARLGCH